MVGKSKARSPRARIREWGRQSLRSGLGCSSRMRTSASSLKSNDLSLVGYARLLAQPLWLAELLF